MTGTERDDLSELAALLNEIRVTWRPLGWPARDSMRRSVLDGLRRFRGQQRPGTAIPDCPHDVSGLVDEPAEALLHMLKIARFNESQLRDRLTQTIAGADAEQQDIKATLARCAALISRKRKTVPMDALRAVIYPEMTP